MPAEAAAHEIRRRVSRPEIAHALADQVARTATRPWVLMEVCGGQTHTLMRYGIGEMIPKASNWFTGPDARCA